MNHPYSPETRDIPLTFHDCMPEKAYLNKMGEQVCNHEGNKFGPNVTGWYCTRLREWGWCPRGFQ